MACQMARASGANGSAIMTFRARPDGGVFNTVINPTITNQQDYVSGQDIWIKFPEKTDLKWRCEDVSDDNSIVTAGFGGILIDD